MSKGMSNKTGKELNQQYRIRAALLVDLTGRYFGSGNRKRAQAVLREPSRWTLWAISKMPLLTQGSRGRMNIPLNPIHWCFLVGIMLIIRQWHRRKWTVKQAEEQYRSGMKQYLEQKGEWFIDKLVDARAVLKANARIAKDPEYSNLKNLTTRTQGTIITTLLGTPLDAEYPRFTATTARYPRWQKWLGLKPGDSPLRILWKAFWNPFRAGLRGDASLLRDINTHFTVAGIAKEQGYNKGRSKDAITAGIRAGVIQRAYNLQDEDGNVTEVMPDPDSGRDFEEVEYKLLVNQLFEVVTGTKDKFALALQYEAIQSGITLEEVRQRHAVECKELGFNTPDAVRKRIKRLPSKYPQVDLLRE